MILSTVVLVLVYMMTGPVDQDGNIWKALGQRVAQYDSSVGIQTRDCCEPFPKAWKDVPAQPKAQIQECLLDWFDIERDQFQSVMDRDAKKCYKDLKNDLATWYRGFDTVDEARASPHPTIRDACYWERCCDRFTSPEFQKVSDRNKANRKKQKFTSFHWLRSYAQHRVKKAAPGLSSAQQAVYEDRIQSLEATQQQLTDAVRQLTDVVRQLAPHIHLPSPDAPPSSSSAANDPDNDAANLGD